MPRRFWRISRSKNFRLQFPFRVVRVFRGLKLRAAIFGDFLLKQIIIRVNPCHPWLKNFVFSFPSVFRG
jgi:hypothetical protein